jgi:membrane protein DedA with SNARE-associated domain
MTIETLIQTYGYPALFAGTVLEGETILIMAGFAAHRGFLSLGWVIAVAFLGSFAGDQTWFYLGRLRGRSFLSRRPAWQPRVDRVHRLLERHQIPVVLGFRFLYGLRNVTPFVIGASGFQPARFLLLNAAGAAIWAVAGGAAGYLFGQTVEVFVEEAKKYELMLFIALAVGGLLVWGVSSLLRRGGPRL